MGKRKQRVSTTERFWKKVNIRGHDECWEWLGAVKTGGYAQFSVKGSLMLVHRYSWILHHGEIPSDGSYHGLCVCHKCDNRLCVNPRHLFLGTARDNMLDRMAKGKAHQGAKTKKLSPDEASEIKKILSSPARASMRSIAKEYGVSHNTIWQIAHGIAWHNG